MKKEKRRNMRSAEAGAHDVFVDLSIRRERERERERETLRGKGLLAGE